MGMTFGLGYWTRMSYGRPISKSLFSHLLTAVQGLPSDPAPQALSKPAKLEAPSRGAGRVGGSSISDGRLGWSSRNALSNMPQRLIASPCAASFGGATAGAVAARKRAGEGQGAKAGSEGAH